MFKKDDKLLCIDDSATLDLRKGEVYIAATDETKDMFITVITKSGLSSVLSSLRFRLATPWNLFSYKWGNKVKKNPLTKFFKGHQKIFIFVILAVLVDHLFFEGTYINKLRVVIEKDLNKLKKLKGGKNGKRNKKS